MAEYFVYVTRTERANFRYCVEAANEQAAIEAARELVETGEPGTWIDTIEGHDDWDGADVEALDDIMAFENGELDEHATLELFSDLVATGQAWGLQGHYGRAAAALIDAGYLDTAGNILKEV